MTNNPKPGWFITVEGVEGVGKTTNMAFLMRCLEQQAVRCYQTREPGGTALAEEIRTVLLSPRDEVVCEDTELLLMFAARAQHLNAVIIPKLSLGEWVICDRFTDASFAYQGGGRGVSLEKIALLENMVQGNKRPNKTILLDAPVEVGMSRAKRRGTLDRFEVEERDFFERVRAQYLERAQAEPKRFCIVDASVPLNDVQAQIALLVKDWFSAS